MEKKNILPSHLPTDAGHDYPEFLEYTKDSLSHVFSIKEGDVKAMPFEAFAQNLDHGAVHSYNVYVRALKAADAYEQQTGKSVDRALLYAMSVMHDSGRFRYSLTNPDDTEAQTQAKEAKRNKAEKEHARYGLAQLKLAKKALHEQGIVLSDEAFHKLENYILNHDFFNPRLDGSAYSEPTSLEGQIVRLADRTSVPVTEEIDRYWETGKRLQTPYFVDSISLQERFDFSFPKI